MTGTTSPRTLAIFDFDGTLAHNDSLWPFLVQAAGHATCYWALVRGIVAYVRAPRRADKRSLVKEILLCDSLRGRRIEDLQSAIDYMRGWPTWIDSTVEALRAHRAKGHTILIATGGLSLYVPAMLSNLPYDDILATEMEEEGGTLTGHMASGNCVRQLKAERVRAYITTHGPFDEIWAYGNAPHDLPMMALAQHTVII